MKNESFFQGIKKGANVLLIDTHYVKPHRTIIDGKNKYTKGELYCIYRDMDTGAKYLEIKEDPKIDIYYTAEEHRSDFRTQREFMPIEHLKKKNIPYRSIIRDIYNEIKEDGVDTHFNEIYDVLTKEGKYRGRNELHKWRHAYGTDVDMEDYVKMKGKTELNPKTIKPTCGFLDIESDVMGASEYDMRNGGCPINAVTLIFDHQPSFYDDGPTRVFTFLLRDYDRYPQQEKFEKKLKKFKKRCHKEFDSKFGDAHYEIMMFDSEIEMLATMFKVQHLMKPDFCAIWNMSSMGSSYSDVCAQPL